MNQTDIARGVWQHYKGNKYRVLGTALHSETLERMVVYKALYGDGELWVRPLSMFTESVVLDGVTVPRFRLLQREEPSLC